MARIEKGMLIRKKLSASVTPIGPWLIVRSAWKTRDKIKAERVDSEYIYRHTNDTLELSRNMVYLPIRAALNISPSIINDIVSGKQWIVAHPATLQWAQQCIHHPEIITFYATNGNKVIVSVDEVKLFQRDRQPWVKIFIKDIITKCIWS